MYVILPAISASGILGVGDQYLCLILLSIGARLGWISLMPELAFVGEDWFIGLNAVLWFVTVAPAYSALLAPGAANTVNTLINFFSGFIVPFSGALVSLASVGVIAGFDPGFQAALNTIHLLDPENGLSSAGLMVVGGGALTSTLLTIGKGAAKPGLSMLFGGVGNTSAPVYATLENVTSLALMTLFYYLAHVNPWLLVALFIIIILITIASLSLAIYQLWRFKRGIGQIIYLIQTQPRQGWAVIAEYFVWGSGWLLMGASTQGLVRLTLWGLSTLIFMTLLPIALAAIILTMPYLGMSIMGFTMLGSRMSRTFLRRFGPVEQVNEQRKEAVAPGLT